LAFADGDGYYYMVDVKSHRTDTHFNMPNLTSVERLTRLYEDDTNYFVALMLQYHVQMPTSCFFVPLASLCLTTPLGKLHVHPD
jgi:hypothetical protein